METLPPILPPVRLFVNQSFHPSNSNLITKRRSTSMSSSDSNHDLPLLAVYRKANLIDTEESAVHYQPGGYHPVGLGDAFENGRYEIHHKLGHDLDSTMWVARDTEAEQWVSLKILKAVKSEHDRAVPCLKQLTKLANGDISSKFIVRLLDDFVHEGPNGIHSCHVFELLGPSMSLFMEDIWECPTNGKLRPETDEILDYSRQVTQAVAFMHESGYGLGRKPVASRLNESRTSCSTC